LRGFRRARIIFKAVIQIPYDESTWDPAWVNELRVETPGNPHSPHIKIYANEKDSETGEKVIFVRCKQTSLGGLKEYVDRVFEKLPEVLNHQQTE
jgi:hypothetical protein